MRRIKPLARPPRRNHAMVLLSGGFDSVAALHWAIENSTHKSQTGSWRYDSVRAISFDYGQPNRDSELYAAQFVADIRGIPWDRLALADAVKGLGSLHAAAPGLAAPGVSKANLAARNPLLLSIAAGHACRVFPVPGGQPPRVDLVIGATLDDAKGFPDCRQEFMEAATQVLALACTGVADVQVRAPWVQKSKKDVLIWCMSRRDALEDVQRYSVSCYAGTRCGTCDPCTLRAQAFEALELEDGRAGQVVMTGGDPARARA